jgi:hypothetical protein
MMSIRKCLLPLALAFAWLGYSPSTAEAKGIMIISSGDSFFELGDIKGNTNLQAGMPGGMKVGYKYSFFGIFWLDLWTWGGEYCLFKDRDYVSIPPEVAAGLLGIDPSKLSKPFWYRFPSLLVIIVGVVLLFVLMAIFGARMEAKEDKLYDSLITNPDYSKALEAATAPMPPPEEDMSANPDGLQALLDAHKKSAFDAGLQVLTDAKIEQPLAASNLKAMVASAERRAKKASA